jgi:hypothetical protein
MIVIVIKNSALTVFLRSLIRMRIQDTKIMRIHADADPQHCLLGQTENQFRLSIRNRAREFFLFSI